MARERAPGSRCAVPLSGSGLARPWARTGSRGSGVRRSGEGWQFPQPGQDLGKQAVPGRQPQHQVAGVADQPARDGDQPPAAGWRSWPCRRARRARPMMSSPRGDGGELVEPGGHGRGEQRAPHPGQVDLGVSADGRWRSAAPSLLSRKRFSTVVRCRYQCSAAAAWLGVDTSRLVRMNAVGVDRPGAGQLGQSAGPAGLGAGCGGAGIRGSAETCSGSSRTRRISSRVSAGHQSGQ